MQGWTPVDPETALSLADGLSAVPAPSSRPGGKTAMTAAPGELDADAAVIARSPLFDADWYLAQSPSARIAGGDPARHYLRVGAALGRDPGPRFETRGYLAAHPDVAAAGLNPLLHFERHGRAEGRQPIEPGRTPTPLAEAVAASRLAPRGWTMTRPEAERVLATSLAPWTGAAEPLRQLRRFDAQAARRYVAAAAALYGPEIAALKASVVIPTHNRAARLGAALRSVLAQSHRNLEVLVVDDGSADDTQAQLARLNDPRLRLWRTPRRGVSAARNLALDHATGAYVFYLDSDNAWTPDHLALMLAGLKATGADCAYAASCLVTGEGRAAGYRGEPFDWPACLARNYVDMNVFAHRAELAGALGGFDTDLRRTVDWDLILRYTKGRAVAFFPYLGCLYHDDAADPSRITNAEPRLYRRMVVEKARRDLGSGAAALASLSLSFGIKIAAPAERRAEWGDFHFAESLAAALARRGHRARIDFRGAWDAPETRADDVALVLRGQEGWVPRPGQLTLLWLISHPDQVPYEEYAGYHAMMVASRSYAALLSAILNRPVQALLQCTNPARFRPAASEAETRGLFVGNSRNEYRDMVRWSLENGIDIDIYGARWAQFLPPGRIAGENILNAELGAAYAAARFVLNDHWPAMRDFGIVSNRVFDVVASGGRLISDRLPALEALFGAAVETVEDAPGLLAAVARPPRAAPARRAAAGHVAAHHSFDARVEGIEAAIRAALTPAAARPEAAPGLGPAAPRRRVGLLACRDGAGWSRSAYLRLISPLTTDHAQEIAGLDLVLLDGPEDPRLGHCDLCVAQGAAVPDPGAARRLAAALLARGQAFYVDVDRGASGEPEAALRLLMRAAREVWVATPALAGRYRAAAGGGITVRPDTLDPRLWRDYRRPLDTGFGAGPLRLVHLGATAGPDDLVPILPAVARLAGEHPGAVELTLLGAAAPPLEAPWLTLLDPPRAPGGYPALARFARGHAFDVGLASDAAGSDTAVLEHGAMGLLSVVSDAPAYLARIDAGLAVGVDPGEVGWYAALAALLARRDDFAAMRQRAADHLWRERNVLTDPCPLADRLARAGAAEGRP